MSDGPWSLADLHGAAVWVGEARVGSVSGVYADADCEQVVGLEIANPDGECWFLPWVTCALEARAIRCASPLVFIGADQLEFYVRRGISLLQENGTMVRVEPDGRVLRSLDGHARGVLAVAGEGTSNL